MPGKLVSGPSGNNYRRIKVEQSRSDLEYISSNVVNLKDGHSIHVKGTGMTHVQILESIFIMVADASNAVGSLDPTYIVNPKYDDELFPSDEAYVWVNCSSIFDYITNPIKEEIKEESHGEQPIIKAEDGWEMAPVKKKKKKAKKPRVALFRSLMTEDGKILEISATRSKIPYRLNDKSSRTLKTSPLPNWVTKEMIIEVFDKYRNGPKAINVQLTPSDSESNLALISFNNKASEASYALLMTKLIFFKSDAKSCKGLVSYSV